jgi:hypothetical protein
MREEGVQPLLSAFLHEKKQHNLDDFLRPQPEIGFELLSRRLAATHEHDAPQSVPDHVDHERLILGSIGTSTY